MPSASYNTKATAFARRVQWVVEIDLDRCDNVYTQSPCTASDAGDGSRCHYGFTTCQDVANFVKTTRTYRFCLEDVPWTDAANPCWPLLKKIVDVPQKIDAAKLWTFPEKIRFTVARDFNPRPVDSDKGAGFYNTGTPGEFWSNLFARNRNWAGHPVRLKRGFFDLDLADFEDVGPTYKLLNINWKSDQFEIEAESPLADLDKAKIPFTINEDNTVQDVGGIDAVDTTVDVIDGSEYPDPSLYTRFSIYVRMGTEICEVTSIATNTLTIVRGSLNTTAAVHAAGVKVEHVAFFGTDNGISTAPTGRNVVEVILDMLDWAGVASGDINTGAFRVVKNQAWPRDDLERIIAKPKKISRLIQPLRETRGIVMFIDSGGKFSLTVMAPNDSPNDISDENAFDIEISDDAESRVTRAAIWYDPIDADDAGDDVKDYQKAVIVVDAELESANFFNGDKKAEITDAWSDAAAAVGDIRLVARRVVTRRRYGAREIAFSLDVKDGVFNVGDSVRFESRAILNRDGVPESRQGVILEKVEKSRLVNRYVMADVAYNGRYMRIAPNTVADSYDSATEGDKAYGYMGDADGRLGTVFDEGYRYW